MDRTTFEKLLAQAAPLLNAQRLTRLSDGDFFLQLTEEVGLDIEFDDTLPRVVLIADVGELREHNKTAAMELLLAYSYAWSVHGGVYAALDDSRKRAAVMVSVPLQELTLQSLISVVTRFRETAEAWRQSLQSVAESNDASAGSIDMNLMNALRI